MKKLITLIFCAAGSCVFAQNMQQVAPPPPAGPSVRIHAYTTYAFDDQVDSYYSANEYFNGKIKGGFEWGGGLELLLNPAYGVEFAYLRLDSKAPISYWDINATIPQEKYTEFDLASNYLMLGVNRYLVVNPKLEPYAGMQFGMAIFNFDNPDNGNSGSSTKFAWGIKAGLNFWASERFGIKMQAALLSAVQSVGGGFYVGSGGSGAGMTSYSTFYQWSLGGGLVLKLR
jgi:hypothetical protein